MNKETESIISTMQEILSGSPWFGKSVLTILDDINPDIVHKKPKENAHSMIELLYHMVTWIEFTQHRLEKVQQTDTAAFNALDWRATNSTDHTWNTGISNVKAGTNKIIELLKKASGQLLEEKVDYREYNFRYLLNGLMQHNIYHLGQIAYVNKLLS
ncbi:MAG: DinB family protein [Chitinophagaceae bacterium]